MALFALIILVVSCALNAAAGIPHERFGSVACRKCDSLDECMREPSEDECPFGYFRDNCGYSNCYQGPKDDCSDHVHSIKRCTTGLHCNSHIRKCTGCVLYPYLSCFELTTIG